MRTIMKQTTRTHILNVCLKLAEKHGYRNITRDAIAAEAAVTASLVSYHLGTMIELRRHVIREAIRTECLPVIAQALTARDRHALKCPKELQSQALMSMAG